MDIFKKINIHKNIYPTTNKHNTDPAKPRKTPHFCALFSNTAKNKLPVSQRRLLFKTQSP